MIFPHCTTETPSKAFGTPFTYCPGPRKEDFSQAWAVDPDPNKPEIRNLLKIGWTVVRGILELAIMVYVLRSIFDSEDTIIVAVLGIIYATIRGAALFQHLTITQMAWAGDRQSLEQRLEEDPNVDSEIANTDATMSRILLNCYIAGTFIALQYLACLTYIFLKL